MSPSNPESDQTNHQEKRHFTRTPFATHANMIGKEGKWKCNVLDISIKGVLIERPAEWSGATGDQYTLDIILNDAESIINMEVVEVARLADEIIGLRCRYIDLEGMIMLKRLMELNLGDPALINREIAQLS